MYRLEDTVFAVATPFGAGRCILRLTGPRAFEIVNLLLAEPIGEQQRLCRGTIRIPPDMKVEASLYRFNLGQSYTGQELLEIHLLSNTPLTEALIAALRQAGAREAGPGEFTARAYLNGKIDLAQAEAVNEIIAATNTSQLNAAEKLLAGKLTTKVQVVQDALLELLSLLEASLDFSQEDIELINSEQAIDRLTPLREEMSRLLQEECRDEALMHLPSVGIAGAPNAGKSSLFNALLQRERSITSSQQHTTRDVLSDTLVLGNSQCVLFDCAGLQPGSGEVLQQLAQEAALESLGHCSLVLFCVDISQADRQEALHAFQQFRHQPLIFLATKCDELEPHGLCRHETDLARRFGRTPLLISARTGANLNLVLSQVEWALQQLRRPTACSSGVSDLQSTPFLTLRHKQSLTDALDHITTAIQELGLGQAEVAAMMIRAAFQALGDIEQHIDEEVLDRIFAQFCIGK